MSIMKTKAPETPMKIVGVRQDRIHNHATFAVVIVEDQDGKKWQFRCSCFNFDLVPMEDKPYAAVQM